MPRRCDLRTRLGERGIRGKVGGVAVEILDAGRDLDASRVDPRPATDPVPCVYRWSI